MTTSESLSAEKTTEPNPCEVAPGEFDHDWETVDDSFDHEYGCEQILYRRCIVCGETTGCEDSDYE